MSLTDLTRTSGRMARGVAALNRTAEKHETAVRGLQDSAAEGDSRNQTLVRHAILLETLLSNVKLTLGELVICAILSSGIIGYISVSCLTLRYRRQQVNIAANQSIWYVPLAQSLVHNTFK